MSEATTCTETGIRNYIYLKPEQLQLVAGILERQDVTQCYNMTVEFLRNNRQC